MVDKTPEALVTERGKTHGDWKRQASCAHDFKAVISQYNDKGLEPFQREALEMICVKMSRILCGNAAEPDHWDDLAGYAVLGKEGHKHRTLQEVAEAPRATKELHMTYKGFAVGDRVEVYNPANGKMEGGKVDNYGTSGIFIEFDRTGIKLWYNHELVKLVKNA